METNTSSKTANEKMGFVEENLTFEEKIYRIETFDEVLEFAQKEGNRPFSGNQLNPKVQKEIEEMDKEQEQEMAEIMKEYETEQSRIYDEEYGDFWDSAGSSAYI